MNKFCCLNFKHAVVVNQTTKNLVVLNYKKYDLNFDGGFKRCPRSNLVCRKAGCGHVSGKSCVYMSFSTIIKANIYRLAKLM